MHRVLLVSLTVLFLLSAASMITETVNVLSVRASGTIYIKADGSVVGTSLILRNGDTYTFLGNINDEIVVEKSYIIIDGNRFTLKGFGSGIGFNLTQVNNVTIQNTNITSFSTGCYIKESFNNTITENNVTDSTTGIRLSSSYSNTLSGNNVTCQFAGFFLSGSSYSNSLFENNATGGVAPIVIDGSPSNTLRDNVLKNGYIDEIVMVGYSFHHYVQDIDESNTADSRPIYYWVSRQDAAIPSDAGYVALINSTNITVEGLDLKNHYNGILLINTTHSIITNNNITDNSYAIWMNCSSFNSFSENNLTRNRDGCVNLDWSDSNSFTQNNITDNQCNGIMLAHSSLNIISGNNITVPASTGIGLFHSFLNAITGNDIRNCYAGLSFSSSGDNTISGNNITMCSHGIEHFSSNSNILFGNNIASNTIGVYLSAGSTGNKFYHNNFRSDNAEHVRIMDSSANMWDDGYPSSGNYWGGHTGIDLKCGSNQDYEGADGIWDEQIEINPNNRDKYPLVSPIETTYSLTIEFWWGWGGIADPTAGVDPTAGAYICPEGIKILATATNGYVDYRSTVFACWFLDEMWETHYENPILVTMDRTHILRAKFVSIGGGGGNGCWAAIHHMFLRL